MYKLTLATSDCDLCHCRAQGGMLHCNETPVLFTCFRCDPASFWGALADEWRHVELFLDVYQNVTELTTDLYMARMEEALS